MIGTTTPEKVARAVVRAIERNRNEITVAPLRQRFLAEIGYRHPEISARLQRRGGAEQIADDLAAGQSHKR
jgi:short-subunit dehydrogenase